MIFDKDNRQLPEVNDMVFCCEEHRAHVYGTVIHVDGDTITVFGAELDGMVIGVLQGDPDVKAFVQSKFPRSKVVEVSDAAINGERTWLAHTINSGKVDAIVYDYPFAVAEIAGTTLQFAIAKIPGSDIRYKIAVRSEEKELLEALNTAIRKTRNTPEYLALMQRYFVSDRVVVAKAATKAETTYLVKKGDTLAAIAVTTLGDRGKYTLIEQRNNLPNPDLIRVGQVLVIPAK